MLCDRKLIALGRACNHACWLSPSHLRIQAALYKVAGISIDDDYSRWKNPEECMHDEMSIEILLVDRILTKVRTHCAQQADGVVNGDVACMTSDKLRCMGKYYYVVEGGGCMHMQAAVAVALPAASRLGRRRRSRPIRPRVPANWAEFHSRRAALYRQ